MSPETSTWTTKKGLAQMLKGGVIMDVVTPEHAKIAEEAGAVAVMALERVPADIRAATGVTVTTATRSPRIADVASNLRIVPLPSTRRRAASAKRPSWSKGAPEPQNVRSFPVSAPISHPRGPMCYSGGPNGRAIIARARAARGPERA